MLFPYTYVPHKMDKMQTFIDFIFHEVWCKAPTGGPFGLNLFDANAELREVMEAFLWGDSKGAEFFYGHVDRIYGLFSALSAAQISQFQQWYQGNNDLEKLCANDPAVHLARYADIAVNHKDLAAHLGKFFKGLYSQLLLDLAALRAKIGDINDHNTTFVQTNKDGKCPFCGISDLLGPNHTPREAYDHYLPKALYPFNSINFRNLVPACHHCNSSYKTSKDPAHKPKDPAGEVVRRKVFYPFSTEPHSIDIQVTLQHADIENLTPADIHLTFGPANVSEQIDTWKDVYGIEERYKAKFCSNDSRDWLEQVRILHRDHNLAPTAYLVSLDKQVQQSSVANCNFLKKPFLDACHSVGLLDAIEKGENAQ